MSKGGATTTTVNQQALPEYAKPYFRELLKRTSSETKRGYETYDDQRLADVNPFEQGAESLVGGFNLSPMYDVASGYTEGAIDQASMDPNAMFNEYGYGNVDDYRTGVGSFMSPYMQNVVDVQKARAQLDFDRAQSGRDAQAVQVGAFGGSRGAVVDALAQEDLARRMDEIQATGQQSAFEAATGAFGDQRLANMQREAERAAELGRVEEGRAGYGLAGAELQGGLASQLGTLAGQRFGEQTGIAQYLDQMGQTVRGREQSQLDLGYEDFLRQQNYPQDQLSFYSSILRGVPVQPNTTTSLYQQTNPLQEALGTGLAALGTYKAYMT